MDSTSKAHRTGNRTGEGGAIEHSIESFTTPDVHYRVRLYTGDHGLPYCQCGCGEQTHYATSRDSSNGYAVGEPIRFLPYHHQRLSRGLSWAGGSKTLPGFRIDRTHGIAIVPLLDCGLETYVDADIADEVGSLRLRRNPMGYVEFSTKQGSKRLHRKITGAAYKQQVDHINGNILDNRSCNLRIVNAAQNKQNANVNGKNTSGFKGVGRSRGLWRAYITVDGTQKFLGRFSDVEDAARAYDSAAREFFGVYARLNFPGEGERGCRA